MRKKVIILGLGFLMNAGMAMSQSIESAVADTTQTRGVFNKIYRYFADSNEDKTQIKKFDFSVIGGPHYSSDIKFGIGLVAAGLYRIDKQDLTLPPSNVSFFGDVTTTGFFLLGIRGNTIFKSDKYRLDYNAYFFSMPSDFWGIGYDNATHAAKSNYKRLQNQIKVDFLFKIASNTYVGPNANFNYIEGRNFDNISYLRGEDARYINSGVGASVMYDSRDFMVNAYRGLFLKIEQRFFPKFMGNKGAFNRTEFTGDFYQQVWKGGVLAYDLHALMNNGDVPWTMLAIMGGSYRMRGYYEGRYRDKNIIETQLELRQRVWRRNGVAVWVGAGNIFPSFSKFNWSQTLPNYGFGYRWEFKNRVNVRLDYGFGKRGQSGFIFNINEAF